MQIDIHDAEAQLSSLVQILLDRKEETIFISKDGKPIAKLSLIKQKNKRVGAAKEEMKNFDISLEEFNNIPIGFEN